MPHDKPDPASVPGGRRQVCRDADDAAVTPGRTVPRPRSTARSRIAVAEDEVGQPDAEVADDDPAASRRGVPATIASPIVAVGSG